MKSETKMASREEETGPRSRARPESGSASGSGYPSGGQREVEVKRILVWVLVINLLVASAKIVVGSLVQSLAILADGFHSLTDAASNIVGWIGLTIAARPPDADHPYGHRKFETLTALAIGAMLALTAWEILRSAVERWKDGTLPEVTPLSIVLLVASIGISAFVSSYESRQGKRLGSQVLTADAAHTRSDIVTSAVVLASLLGSRLGWPHIDLVAALLVTLVIAWAALQIVRESVDNLTDVALAPESKVVGLALEVPGVLGAHKVRSRSGIDGGHCDLHVQVDADLRIDRAHVIGHLVVEHLQQELGIADVVVHVEPPEGHRTHWEPSTDDEVRESSH